MPRPKTTLRQLSYFVALADTGSFTRAAEQMGVSQPSLSQQIRALETIIGAPLFERGVPAILTPLGSDLLDRARSILLDVTDLEEVRTTSTDTLIGTIRLGVSPTLGAYLMPSLVARLHREHPALRVHVREGLPTVLARDLANGVHDLILAQLPVAGSSLHSERLFREPLHVTMAADHPLRSKRYITPADLRGANLLTLMPEYRLAEQVAAIAMEVGAHVLRDYEGTSLDAIRQMAGMGMGLALLPELYVRQEIREGDDVVVRPIKGGRYYREIGLLWRQGAGRAPAFGLIADLLRAAAA
ncbi:hydrogen peroxide-inducible genes activator [Xanthomonas sp. WHRI 10064A]|uniref:hydrogen peroxide-inducible genes activator n=1 Tax=unclassified Xanthomonas TaxID=2643310 RepID=UPI002B2272EC|nr:MULTISPECIES: hydrogen peroxide-inducible genes activator [unclassified Xanthomonas]MEA9587915.1 hydrogen peroxide-inducible genes activator [Xanthomonas sp. WHRI 10064B]MEA9615637.1 hydrogen peroxide-inducible genes activator [Xanthomonas sp. WHRI 10064A]